MLKVLLHFNFKVIVMHMYNSENVPNPPGHLALYKNSENKSPK